MKKVRLQSITYMEFSYDCFCFGNKELSSKCIVFILPIYGYLFTVAQFPDKKM